MSVLGKPRKIIYEVVSVKDKYRIRRSVFYSGHVGNPPLVKLLTFRSDKKSDAMGAAFRCAKSYEEQGYRFHFAKPTGKWICELDLDGE